MLYKVKMPDFHINYPFVMIVRFALVAVLGLASMLMNAGRGEAGPRDDMLYWSTGAEFENISPYYDFRPEVEIFSHLVWDRLFYREPNSPTFKPHLATKMKWVGITTVEIDLRKDVVFHNGDRFSADDIVEMVRRLKNAELGTPEHRAIKWIGKIKKLASHRVRVDLTRPMPQLRELLSGSFPIIPRAAWRAAPMDGNGRPDYTRMPPIGSGPYRVSGIEPGSSIELERFRKYHKGPKGRPAIGRIMFSTVANPQERREQLLDGRIDWLGGLSKEAYEQMKNEGVSIKLVKSPSLRIAFLLMDRAGRNDEKSPFRDIRIRRAVAHAINRPEIAFNIFGTASKVMHSLCHPKQAGCEQDVRRYKYDPAKARMLLRAAGYGPAGDSRLVDRLNNLAERLPGKSPETKKRLRSIVADIVSYRNHPASEAMSLYLKAIGVDSTVDDYRSFETARRRLQSGSFDLAHMTWASHGALDVAEILNPLFRDGPFDYCRDREVNRWLDVAANTNNAKARARAYSNALKRLQELVCVVPLFNYTTFYAHSRRLDFQPALDDIPRFYRAKWK
jgi:peptide/nickel transport system substrate-binding protein